MARASRKRRSTPEPVVAVVPRPDRVVAGLAAAGVLVAGYLTWLKLTGAGAALCVAGGGGDLVQAGRWAIFLGVPAAGWGLAVYVAIAVLALVGLSARNWLIAYLLAAGGVGVSIYLTALSVLDVGAACIWCLTSGAILAALLVALVMRRPPATPRAPRLR